MSHTLWMIYGATGMTGTLIAEEAIHRGHQPLLVGRSALFVDGSTQPSRNGDTSARKPGGRSENFVCLGTGNEPELQENKQ